MSPSLIAAADATMGHIRLITQRKDVLRAYRIVVLRKYVELACTFFQGGTYQWNGPILNRRLFPHSRAPILDGITPIRTCGFACFWSNSLAHEAIRLRGVCSPNRRNLVISIVVPFEYDLLSPCPEVSHGYRPANPGDPE